MKKGIGFYFKYISDGMKKDLNNVLSIYDITSQQGHILIYLIHHEKEGINQKKIEEIFNLKNSTISGILKRLETKEMIKRSIDENDNRYKVIKVLPKAYELKDILDRKKEEVEKELMNNLSKEEVEELFCLLQKVANNIDNLERNLND